MELKGLKVNIGKTKVMTCGDDTGGVQRSGKWPCGVCEHRVDVNSDTSLHKLQEVGASEMR